ncbi:MAG: hypothetical protein IKI93_05585 [Clostridia bacterium]|nr:hypothetical protein [Clostridia bacterium]
MESMRLSCTAWQSVALGGNSWRYFTMGGGIRQCGGEVTLTKEDLQKKMDEIYPAKKEEQKETAAAGKVHRPENNGRFHKPRQSEKLKEDDISAVMEVEHDFAEEGEIYDEGVRDDIPG